MAKTINLASVLLKCGLGGERSGEKKGNGAAAVNLIMLICILPIMYFVFRAGMFYGDMAVSLDPDGLVMNFLLFAITVFIFCVGIISCINSFYLSNNISTLLVMPFTPGQITGAKFLVAAVYEYYISIVVVAPFLVGAGVAMKAPVLYWITALVTVVVLPLPPLALGAIVAMIIMRFIGRAKNKEMTTILGAIGLVILAVVFEIIQNSTKGIQASDVESALQHMASQLQSITMSFPNVPFLGRAMVGNDAMFLLWGVLVVLAYLLVFWLVAGRLYLSGVIGMQEGTSGHKTMSVGQAQQAVKTSKIEQSYLKKELRTILRTPAFYINCLFITLGWPIIMVVPMLFSAEQKAELVSLEKIILSDSSTNQFVFVLSLLIFAVTLFSTSLNSIAVSSISREGQGYQIMKQLPIPYMKQLSAKKNAAMVICWIGSGGYMLLAEIALVVTGHFPWWTIPYTLVLNFIILEFFVNIEMMAGVAHPILSWESEADAMRHNRANIVLFLLGLIAGCVIAYMGYAKVNSLPVNQMMFAGAVAVAFLILAVLTQILFAWYGKRKMERL